MKTLYNGKKNCLSKNVWLSISTKSILKKVFINYAQNNVVQLPPSNAIAKWNYIFIDIKWSNGIFWKINTCTNVLQSENIF